jgi:hypothetical protein
MLRSIGWAVTPEILKAKVFVGVVVLALNLPFQFTWLKGAGVIARKP